MKILVVGGVAGGATAIARLRRLSEDAQIILFERGEYVSYANCGLPYYIGGAISDREKLFVTNKETIMGKYNVDIRVSSEVISIDTKKKTVRVKDIKNSSEYDESYDKILLSTGSHPFVPKFEGVDSPNVFTLWTVNDTDRIYEYIAKESPKNCVVVGGGFIGLEMVENLVERGINVTLVEKMNQVMPPIDSDMAKLVANHLVEKGVKVLLNKGLKDITSNGKLVNLDDGSSIESDFTLLSIGVRPNNELAKSAGLELNERGGIVVDEYMQTSNKDIYAVGDVIEVVDFNFKDKKAMVPLAGPANKQGRAVAANILGLKNKEKYQGTMGTSAAKVFDLSVASTGVSEKILERNGYIYKKDYFIAILHPMSNANYYPGGKPMTIKLIFAKDGKVLGAQIVGYAGVDKRIDVISSCIHFGGSVDDLTKLELAYAPPYSSAKDPVNYAGYIAQNILNGLTDVIRVEEYIKNKDSYKLLDIRENAEISVGKMENSIHIPLTELRGRLNELNKNDTYVVFCAVGLRGYLSERVLKQNGFKVLNILGGLRFLNEIKKPLKRDGNIGEAIKMDTNQDKFNQTIKKDGKVISLDLCGMSCPGPIVKVAKAIADIEDGDSLSIVASDPGFLNDIGSWCINTNNTLISTGNKEGLYCAVVQKGIENDSLTNEDKGFIIKDNLKEKTMIVFSGDLDKAIASFIIANGAAAMGNKVNMFFTFWGLNVLRKPKKVKVRKNFISKMFGAMMPRGSKKLGLSKMNMGGAGAKLIRKIMKDNNVDSLEAMINQAIEAGVSLTACQMSMDLMGIKHEELIDGIKVGGVASMLNDNDNSNMNLFI